MARSVAARYLMAASAFMATAIWVGVGLSGGFTCLFVFVLALQAVRLYQRRSESRNRRSTPRRERPFAPSAPPARRERSRSTGRIYDGDREELAWPVASEATW